MLKNWKIFFYALKHLYVALEEKMLKKYNKEYPGYFFTIWQTPTGKICTRSTRAEIQKYEEQQRIMEERNIPQQISLFA